MRACREACMSRHISTREGKCRAGILACRAHVHEGREIEDREIYI